MNLVTQMNGFTAWQIQNNNDITLRARSLYIALLQFANRAGWPEEIIVANGELIAMARLAAKPTAKQDRTALTTLRNELKTKGLITWRSQKGNKAPAYTLTDLSDLLTQKHTQVLTQIPTQKHTQKHTQVPTIYINNKDKENDNDISVQEHQEPSGGFGDEITVDFMAERRTDLSDLADAFGYYGKRKPEDPDFVAIEKAYVEYGKAAVEFAFEQGWKNSKDGEKFNWAYFNRVMENRRNGAAKGSEPISYERKVFTNDDR